MERRRISILGVTGSIGRTTLQVMEALGSDRFSTVAVTGNGNIAGLAEAARRLRAEVAVTADPDRLDELRAALGNSGIEASAGPAALIEAAGRPTDLTMSAIVGAAGLEPTLAAARNGGTIALANKECLVAAGGVFLAAIARSGATLLPVDSEHNAIFQLTAAERDCPVERLILTASGGPFRTRSLEEMSAVTVEQAKTHPNWSMGARITIDSASMFNKALEMIEAWQLFRVSPDQVEVIVHPQSIIHSMIGFRDGSILAHLGPPDMSVAIGHALGWPERKHLPVDRLDFAALSRLDFEAPDPERFPALDLARRAMETGGQAPCVLNGAKEIALDAFIAGRIGFLDMARVTGAAMDALESLSPAANLQDVLAADGEARRVASGLVERFAA
ncbi:MAG: 1-deoxy-D-xylulose-5-phosphate reductoisomerase [Pseudomonadota bacterium]